MSSVKKLTDILRVKRGEITRYDGQTYKTIEQRKATTPYNFFKEKPQTIYQGMKSKLFTKKIKEEKEEIREVVTDKHFGQEFYEKED